ncbi:hypothetical protein E2C01_068825 [Portunus trituberculatus]|uniref:Uncharacterized protein n=1 Tax=Portunus trituberculatus TaxID=210409 RepID=A0A5B7HXK5_PORTR|nr:hypothetical protein [Portunus trituberculatus]
MFRWGAWRTPDKLCSAWRDTQTRLHQHLQRSTRLVGPNKQHKT